MKGNRQLRARFVSLFYLLCKVNEQHIRLFNSYLLGPDGVLLSFSGCDGYKFTNEYYININREPTIYVNVVTSYVYTCSCTVHD